jgi:hypothetical protein
MITINDADCIAFILISAVVWMEAAPSFADPFPQGLRDQGLAGCFALDDPKLRRTQDSNSIPILYKTKVVGSNILCSNLAGRIKAMDQECVNLKKDLGTFTCPDNQFVELVGKPICDHYEDTLGLYLAECDCLKRDRVPELADVVKACRDKASAEEQAIDRGERKEESRIMGTKDEPQKLCDLLEQYKALNITGRVFRRDMDYFTHLFSRYAVRSSWAFSMSKALDDETKRPPSPYCIYQPCRYPMSNVYHASISEFNDSVPRKCEVQDCEVNIGQYDTEGQMVVRDNIVDINCTGGKNCSLNTDRQKEIMDRIKQGTMSVDDYPYDQEDLTIKCGKFGKCQPNGRCLCDPDWTGPECRQKRVPDPKEDDTDDPLKPAKPKDAEGDVVEPTAPAPAPSTTKTATSSTATVIIVIVIGGLIGIGGLFALRAFANRKREEVANDLS